MSKRLGYLGTGTGIAHPFDDLFPAIKKVNPDKPESFNDLDVLVVWGGGDISPAMYGQTPSMYTGADDELSAVDKLECKAMMIAIAKDLPILGICRGAQMACAMAGGKLVQHVTDHAGCKHEIETDDGRIIITNSLHHQMMYPWDTQHELIAWSRSARSKCYIGSGDKEMEFPRGAYKTSKELYEPEVVYFPVIKALAIQGHPEFLSKENDYVKYCQELVSNYILGGNNHAKCE